MTQIVQSPTAFFDKVVIGCTKDAEVVTKIRRRRYHRDEPIFRDFVIIPEGLRERDLPRGLFDRMRLRSHLSADSDELVQLVGNEIILGTELSYVQESLSTDNLELGDVAAQRYTYDRDRIAFNFIVYRITRHY